jgi:maltose O-acetyltransferase
VSQKHQMLAGELYHPGDVELAADRERCEELLHRHNNERDPQALTDLLAAVGPGTTVRAPFFCDYGYNVSIGSGVFVNFGCVFLDCAPITVGDGAQIGPAVQLLAADHPLDPGQRRDGLELAAAIDIGENVWMGGGALVCPGVTIGPDSVIGAGSVVTHDIPAGVVAVGNPCRVLRPVRQ